MVALLPPPPPSTSAPAACKTSLPLGSRFTPRGVYAGAQDHTITGTVRGNDFDGTIATVFFGADASAEYAMRKA